LLLDFKLADFSSSSLKRTELKLILKRFVYRIAPINEVVFCGVCVFKEFT
jgi:hypothetical protein